MENNIYNFQFWRDRATLEMKEIFCVTQEEKEDSHSWVRDKEHDITYWVVNVRAACEKEARSKLFTHWHEQYHEDHPMFTEEQKMEMKIRHDIFVMEEREAGNPEFLYKNYGKS